MKVDNQHVQQKVFDSAKKLLFTRGVKGWNTDMLAREAGLAKNTLYKIIGSKEQIVEAVAMAQVRENAESAAAFLQTGIDWADKQKTLQAVRTALERFTSNMSRFEPVVLPQIYLQYPGVEVKINALVKDLTLLAHDFFRQAKDHGFIRPEVDPEVVMDMARAMVAHYIRQGADRSEFEDRVKKAFDYVLQGIAA
ncbi:transcriptional regulator, TetR family [Desulfatibacillum alkenivorans DSM 16219]|uniref:Transcriptional regulator, TetR family n=1 Tax=Desulfatibacillum alkenivorans DSM 16219 TaxID=1121393 RepID=A0A1M6MGB5_9BACT|nr:TetR/AcrR family transcriptional regulator [Desulfatibacillum alkenivorans]SHJ82494.1 transcriptional regulator, TetR family [Desulfatibacillum alkenivorans DSM 16219]